MTDKDKRIYQILKYLNQNNVRKNINLEDWALKAQFDFTGSDYDDAFKEIEDRKYIDRRPNNCIVISEDGEIKYNELHSLVNESLQQEYDALNEKLKYILDKQENGLIELPNQNFPIKKFINDGFISESTYGSLVADATFYDADIIRIREFLNESGYPKKEIQHGTYIDKRQTINIVGDFNQTSQLSDNASATSEMQIKDSTIKTPASSKSVLSIVLKIITAIVAITTLYLTFFANRK